MNKFAIAHPGKNAKLASLAQKAKLAALAITAGALTVAQPAMAEAIDVAAVVSDVKGQIAAVVLLGGAVLLVYAAVKAFKWVRSAMS